MCCSGCADPGDLEVDLDLDGCLSTEWWEVVGDGECSSSPPEWWGGDVCVEVTGPVFQCFTGGKGFSTVQICFLFSVLLIAFTFPCTPYWSFFDGGQYLLDNPGMNEVGCLTSSACDNKASLSSSIPAYSIGCALWAFFSFAATFSSLAPYLYAVAWFL